MLSDVCMCYTKTSFLKELMEYEHNRHKYVACLDEAGVGLLHKAVFYNYMDIIEWLVSNYPHLVHQKDSVSTKINNILLLKFKIKHL